MRIFLFSLVLLSTIGLSAQELTRSVVGSAGSYFSAVNAGNLHWTLGEVAVDRTQNGIVLERGFHHGNYEFLSTAVWTAPDVDLTLTAFPNPTVDQVTLEGDWENGDRVQIRDFLGRQLSDQLLAPAVTQIDMKKHPSGAYLFTIIRQGRPLKSLHIIRQ